MKYVVFCMAILLTSCADVGYVKEETASRYEYNFPNDIYDLESAFFYVSSMCYVSDLEAHGKEEFWQAPKETIARGTGDCEDFAILFSSLADKLGSVAQIQIGNGHCISVIDGIQYDPSPIFTAGGFVSAEFEPDTTEYSIDNVFDIGKAIERAIAIYDTY